MKPEHARDYASEQADQAGREDDRSFQEMVDDEKPHYSERETKMCELIEYLYARIVLRPHRENATEQMRDIYNTPDKMRLALLEIQAHALSLSKIDDAMNQINDIATNALK